MKNLNEKGFIYNVWRNILRFLHTCEQIRSVIMVRHTQNFMYQQRLLPAYLT